MRVTASREIGWFAALLCCIIGLSGCREQPTASLELSAERIQRGSAVRVCYTLPPGIRAAFISPSLDPIPQDGFHDVTDTPHSCADVRVAQTTTFTLETIPARAPLQRTLVVDLPSTPIARITPRPMPSPTQIPTPRPVRTHAPLATGVVSAVEAVAGGSLCPSVMTVRGSIALRAGGLVSYHLNINGQTSSNDRHVRVPVGGNLGVTEQVPFAPLTPSTATLVITRPVKYLSPALPFKLRCALPPAAQAAIWKAASARECKPHSGFPGSGCARTVNAVIAEALGHSVPPGAPPFYCGGLRGPGQPWDPEQRHRCTPTWVPDVVQMIEEHAQFGSRLNRAQTLPGDIAVQDGTNPVRGMNHIGFCEDAGCNSVLSNRSSTGQLCGHTNATMSNNGYPYRADREPTFYRVYGVTRAIQ